MSLASILYPLIGLILLNGTIPFLMSQLNVPMSSYMNYLFWVNALLIFALILPGRVGSMFDET
mgnify:FL=1